MIYLDIHIVIWFYAGFTQRFSEEIRETMNTHDWRISPIVRLELQHLHEIGRINPKADTIISSLSERVGLTVCTKPFTDVISRAMQLMWSRDPFDRILVAHACIDEKILISSDGAILDHYEFAKW